MKELASQQYKRLFKASSGKLLILHPENFEIVAVTEDYLKATHTHETDLLGKKIFDVFPDNPQELMVDGVQNLRASLQRVRSLKILDTMGLQRYPIRLADGRFEERFWSPVNKPVLDEAGDIEFILHQVEDVTTIVQENSHQGVSVNDNLGRGAALQEFVLRTQKLRQTFSKLQEYEARMRTAERMLGLGTWEFDASAGGLNWSAQVFDIYGLPHDQPAPNLEHYFMLVHPEDREAARQTYAEFTRDRANQLKFAHRIITPNGQVKHVKGVGERHLSPDGEVIVGYVLDTSPTVQTQHQLTRAEQLLHLAGEKAKLGGWRVELGSETSTWTPGTAAIHGMPANYSPPNVTEAINFYAPDYRGTVLEAFEKCAREGYEFDVVCRLETPDGRRPWVRAIGVPERDESGKIVAVQGAFQDISPLREAQTKAEEAERQRLNVLESISDAFLAIDTDWNFTYANAQACALLRRSPEDILGKNLWQVYPETVGSEFERQYRHAVASRQTVRFQHFYPPLSMWVDIAVYPIPDGLAVYFRDVTSDRQHQEQLRLVNAALSRLNDVVMITDALALDEPDGPRIVYVNDAFERQTGYTKDEAIGRTPRMLQGPASSPEQRARIRTALEKKEPIRCEVLNYAKSGKSYWLELDITPLFDDQGLCTHYVAVERDITQRKHQEDELKQAQERFELISKATNDVIWDWSFTANKVWWNNSVTDVFGYTLSELAPGPESWTDHIHPDDTERVVHGIHEVIDGTAELWSAEYRFLKADASYAHVVDRGFVIRDENGKAIRMVGSMLDITDRMEIEQKLRESQKLEALGHLTGGIAHDFNNLLTVVLGNAEMLAELSTDPQIKPMAEMTLSAAKRGAELTSRLLAFARRQPLDPKPTDINEQVRAMRPLIRRTLPENIELEFIPAPSLGTAEVDAGELDTALLNLVVNARDAMPGGGRLTIETANASLDETYANTHSEVLAGDYVMICVSDTGVGMDTNTLQRVFEPFFTTKPVGKGNGLGLSMVFGFTKQSGGHISVYSEPGEGTTVKLYFPKIQSAAQSPANQGAQTPLTGGTEHILVAEDDDLVLQNLAGQLRMLGYRVTTVTNGPDALDALKNHSDIDLLLTDIIMPGGMNGRELADKAQQAYPDLKVLFTSGYTENAIVHQGRLDAGVDLLSKPYTRYALSTKIRKVLDKNT